MDSVTVENPVEREAMRYLEDQAYTALLSYKEPVRSGEISAMIGKEMYSAKLVRHVLAASPRFAQIDRRWDLEVRYEDKQRPLERVLREIVEEYGQPISIEQVANELSSVYERAAGYYIPVVTRLLSDESKYFVIEGETYGLRDWLLDPAYDDEQDVIFYNDLNEDEIRSLEGAAAKANWASGNVPTAVEKFLNAADTPAGNKVASFFFWRAVGEDFDPVGAFRELFSSPDFVWLSDGRWASASMVEIYDVLLSETADRLVEEIVEEAPTAVIERAEVEAEVAPTLSLTISERDLDEVAQIVSSKGEAKMPFILESIFEISPRDPVYAVAAEGLSDAMRLDARFTWVGTERWRMSDTIPEYVNAVPAELHIPTLEFESAEGERLDVELEDEGLEGGLDVEIHNPLVQDVGDEDAITEQDELPPVESARCVLTRNHLKLGAFPLCRIPKTFFPAGPHLIQVTLTDGEKKSDIWVNRETGLVYDMGKWYTEEMPESGAVFTLIRTEKPDEFRFEYNNDTDPLAFIPPNRVQELLDMAERVREQEIPTMELMYDIMAFHRKGIPFVTLFTEVNLVRRTTRRLVASILSSYYAFYQKAKSASWHFDEKKVDQGFKKAKRKYVRK